MLRDASKHLVMLIDEHRILAAAPGDPQPVTIDLPGRWSDMQPQAISTILNNQLGSTRLAIGRVVVGVPVSWVLTQRLTVPSTDPAATAGAVKLRISRDYATDAGNLVGDYTARHGDTGNEVLIGVTTRSKLRSLTETLEQAGLTPVAIHITAQAYVDHKQPDAMIVRVHPPMAELAWVRHGYTVGLRSLCDSLAGNDAADAARAIASSIATDPELADVHGEFVLAADPTSGIDPQRIVAHLNGVANSTVTVVDASAIDTLRRRAGQPDMLDLLRCRASKETTRTWTTVQKLVFAAAILALLLLFSVGGLWWSREHRFRSLRATAAQIEPDVASLSRIKSRLDQSAPWFDKRVDMLSCMQVLTGCVPERGDLRLTEFRLNDDHSGSLQGRAESRAVMLQFLNTMQSSDRLAGVALRDSAETQNGHREVRFEITFNFTSGGGGR